MIVVIATSVWVQVNRARALEQQAEERSRRAKQAIEQAIRDVGNVQSKSGDIRPGSAVGN